MRHLFLVRFLHYDKDLYQLIDDGRVVIYDPMKKSEIDSEKCFEKFGVYPDKIGEYLSLVGDSADNIPGVKGIGPKGAKKLLDEVRWLRDDTHQVVEETVEAGEQARAGRGAAVSASRLAPIRAAVLWIMSDVSQK